MTRTALAVAAPAAALAVAYPILWRSRCLTWGATPEEASRAMPGDTLLTSADVVTTRAITVAAPPSAIWPWLVQMGPERGGAYTYDWIENLFGLPMHSADTIVPEFQHVAVGDTQSLGTHGPTLRIAVLEPEHALVLHSEDGSWVWSFGLYPGGTGQPETTRLISRNRIATGHRTPFSRLFNLYVMEPGSLLMERKMLIGVKHRAENQLSADQPADPEPSQRSADPANKPTPRTRAHHLRHLHGA